ncbi:MAG: metallophosphoesterase family protein [Elusimicrobia bacterium]|nr:metallophosphoesterase family protein [Elusimicrobiota bacterium]
MFSDVHANLEALEEVLDFFEASAVDGYICCGDLVGYGPDPETCVARIAALKNSVIVCGNHDLVAVERLELSWFNPYAKTAAIWTRPHLSDRAKAYLAGLSPKREASGFTVAHGTPRRPPEEYMMSAAQFRENIPYAKVWPVFVGHSHMSLCFRLRQKAPSLLEVESQCLEDGQTFKACPGPQGLLPAALNPGSVGQPRDHDTRASCALYDSETGVFKSVRLTYDIAAVQRKIRRVGLPEYLALRLAYGQ